MPKIQLPIPKYRHALQNRHFHEMIIFSKKGYFFRNHYFWVTVFEFSRRTRSISINKIRDFSTLLNSPTSFGNLNYWMMKITKIEFLKTVLIPGELGKIDPKSNIKSNSHQNWFLKITWKIKPFHSSGKCLRKAKPDDIKTLTCCFSLFLLKCPVQLGFILLVFAPYIS